MGDEPAPWTIDYGPSGGWFITVRARITGIVAEELPVHVEASAPLSETEGFWSETYVMLTPEDDGAAYVGPYPQAAVRMFPIDENPYDLSTMCDRAGLEVPLGIDLTTLDDQDEPVDRITVDHTIRFVQDPEMEPYCD